MQIKQIDPQTAPMALLLIADPNQAKIREYLANSMCWAAYIDQQIVGVAVAVELSAGLYELMNIAIDENQQQLGIGSALLKTVINDIGALHAKRLELGTGTFGHQLSFYQRHGFRVDRIDKDFFLNNYPEPIWENGIQHKDMLRLALVY